MKTDFNVLVDEAARPEWAKWREVLEHVARLHQLSMLSGRAPMKYDMETIGTGYCYGPAFGSWDLCCALLDSCPVLPEHTERQLDNQLVYQRQDGFLPGAIYFRGDQGEVAAISEEKGFPPLWVMVVDAHAAATGSDRLQAACLEPLRRQIRWFEENRRADGFGFYYLDVLNEKWESGVDESLRTVHVKERGKFPCVDATSHVRLLYDAACRWMEPLGLNAAEYREKRDELDRLIQTRFYCRDTGFFHDAHLIERGVFCRTLDGIWPLVCGAAAAEQASRVVSESLLNPARFFSPHPLPYVAMDEPWFELRMWRGPAWNSVTLFAALGCERYGHSAAAAAILERTLDSTMLQFRRTGVVWEFYHPMGGFQDQVERKPSTPFRTPCREYLAFNPLFAMARAWSRVAHTQKQKPSTQNNHKDD